jgi:hypothetical protein
MSHGSHSRGRDAATLGAVRIAAELAGNDLCLRVSRETQHAASLLSLWLLATLPVFAVVTIFAGGQEVIDHEVRYLTAEELTVC